MDSKNILTQTENEILTLTINRPERLNALNRATLAEIRSAVSDAYGNRHTKGIIITGAGEKAFAAGADISEFKDLSVEAGKSLSASGHEIFNLIEGCPKPVIAAVNGFALGGGCELAMACHLRVASENARFGQPEVNLGLIPGYGGTQRLVRYIGRSKALELLMTADMLNAHEALQLGLVNYVTTREELLSKCKEILEKIKTKSPLAIGEVIHCVNDYCKDGVDGFQNETARFGKCCSTEDFKEGAAAFLEKRKPCFTGK